jgi:hypothetical protein
VVISFYSTFDYWPDDGANRNRSPKLSGIKIKNVIFRGEKGLTFNLSGVSSQSPRGAPWPILMLCHNAWTETVRTCDGWPTLDIQVGTRRPEDSLQFVCINILQVCKLWQCKSGRKFCWCDEYTCFWLTLQSTCLPILLFFLHCICLKVFNIRFYYCHYLLFFYAYPAHWKLDF